MLGFKEMSSDRSEYVAVYTEPVWRDRANFIIMAEIQEQTPSPEREQLWVKQLESFRFELCCIPFFAYDLALGDEVETDAQYLIRRIVKDSGHYAFRAWFGESDDLSAQDDVVVKVRDLKCALEWSSANLLAIDAPNETLAQKVADYLSIQ